MPISRQSDHDHDASDAPPLLAGNVDIGKIERAVREILVAIGEDPDREGLIKTPNRVARGLWRVDVGVA